MIRHLALLVVAVLFAMLGAQSAKPLGINPIILGLTMAFIGQILVKLDHFLTYWEVYMKTKNEFLDALKDRFEKGGKEP